MQVVTADGRQLTADNATEPEPLLAIADPRNCFWIPRDILYTESLWDVFSGPK